jgi:hypothetical protein
MEYVRDLMINDVPVRALLNRSWLPVATDRAKTVTGYYKLNFHNY